MREMEEETGYAAREFTEIARVYIVPAYSDEKIYVYLARGLKPATQHLDADEILEVVKYPFDEVLRLIRENVIVDALTVLSIHQAHMYLRNSHIV
jgi:ADP-ribose pyrophosphatase